MIIPTLYSQGSWEKLNVQTDQYLKSVYFTDSLHGWIVGDSGIILHTSDGGETWDFQNSQTKNEIFCVFFLNQQQGWASSFDFSALPYGTNILSTTNGGLDWNSVPYPESNIFITCIFFRDSLTGWMGGTPHALVKTTDGGQSWHQASIDTTNLAFFPVLNITFYDDKHGFAGGGMLDIAGTMWRTSDAGNHWTPVDAMYAPADEIHGIHMFDSLNIMAAGGDPDFGYGVAIMRSLDGGLTWDYEELGYPGNAFDLDFRTSLEAWCPLGNRRKLIYTQDAGDTWTQIDTPDSTAIFDMDFPDSLHGFAVGQQGAVLRYIPPLPTQIQSFESVSDIVEISSVSPNPFSSVTFITLKIAGKGASHIYLEIFNSKGDVISVPVDRELIPGQYRVPFFSGENPRGVYFYHLVVNHGQMIRSGKMIKVK